MVHLDVVVFFFFFNFTSTKHYQVKSAKLTIIRNYDVIIKMPHLFLHIKVDESYILVVENCLYYIMK
jgi:hypothetical protein